ncbi:MAG: SMC-Scp complex subunit ScpB [Thermodesulfovibrionales bacterium]|nr:SMC-Scp complex subunit ScpB [Thermodesulfovibrionales bacterium]
MEEARKKPLLEALLFVSGETVTVPEFKAASELPEAEIKGLMEELIQEYRERNSGVVIAEIAGGYQMVTNPEYAEWVRKFSGAAKAQKLSLPALETLAIIAYKQPMIKAEVEELRGVNSDGVIKTLLEKRLIKIVGKKEAPGRPLLYTTTTEFLQYFGLKDLSELPTLKDLDRQEAA